MATALKRAAWISFILIAILLIVAIIVDIKIHHTSLLQENKIIIQDAISETPHQGPTLDSLHVYGPTNVTTIKILSNESSAYVSVNGETVYTVDEKRGIHIVIISQSTGKMMASRQFDTYTPGGDDGLPDFINSINNSQILCFTICGSVNIQEHTFSMKSYTKEYIHELGSKLIDTLKWRDTWAFVTIKGHNALGEDAGRSEVATEWGKPVNLEVLVPHHVPSDAPISSTNVPISSTNVTISPANVTISPADKTISPIDGTLCKWPNTPENKRRATFCAKYKSYNNLHVCSCTEPLPLVFEPKPLKNNSIADVPVTVIASNRPAYLFRMLTKLLSVPGSNASMVTVYIDGFFQEPSDVSSLFGVESVQNEPFSTKKDLISIAHHYKVSLSMAFEKYPKANYTIILEEDLEVAEDFFSYFSQTCHLMEIDPSIYCISAWNDQGYDHSCQDPSLLYRINTMPGLGWMLSRRLYKEELEEKWPMDKHFGWDDWMRRDDIIKGRECVIPDISRTYHFGAEGTNVHPLTQKNYFNKHSINTVSDVVLTNVSRMVKDKYEEDIIALLKRATVLDHHKNPCGKDFIPDTVGKLYVMFISMDSLKSYNTWKALAKCYHVWDLGARGFHNGLLRIWLKGNQVLVVGVPLSKYISFKPDDVVPIKL